MLPRPKHTPRTHLKHPSSNSRQGASERVWLKRFWLVFGLLGLTAIGRGGAHIPARSGARPGDRLWLVGPLGDAMLRSPGP